MKTRKLKKMNVCKEAILYVQTQKSPAKAWNNCERGDWMLFIAQKLNVDDKKLTMAKAMIAKQAEHLMKDQRSKDILQACFDYANGKITREELNIDAAGIFADAALAAISAANTTYGGTAAYAAYAVGADSNDSRIFSLKKSADICREYLTKEVLSNYRKLK